MKQIQTLLPITYEFDSDTENNYAVDSKYFKKSRRYKLVRLHHNSIEQNFVFTTKQISSHL